MLGLYPGFLKFLPNILTETISIFLVSAFIYFICLSFNKKNISVKYYLTSAIMLTAIIYTRAIFGYVLISLILVIGVATIIFKTDHLKNSLKIVALSFLLCIPYLIFTYTVSGKILQWASSTGDTIYWMTTPYQNEYGDWSSFDQVQKYPGRIKNHGQFIDSIKNLQPFQYERIMLSKSIENIKNHPLKFIFNWSANIGRLFFNYPYSYTIQKMDTYFYIIPNMFLVVFMFFSGIISLKHFKILPFEIKFLILFTFIYLGGSSLLSAEVRYSFIAIPPLLFWIAYVTNNLITIKLKDS